jgi:hypothetical protein
MSLPVGRIAQSSLLLAAFSLSACQPAAPVIPPGISAGAGTIQATPKPADAASPATGAAGAPPKSYLYVMNGLAKTIDEIDLQAGTVNKSVLPTGLYPNQLVSIGSLAWMVNSGDATIDGLDLRGHRKVGTINLATGANPMTLAPVSAHEGIVVNYLAKNVAFVNLDTLGPETTVSLPQGQPGGGLAIANGKAYVAATTADYSKYPAISYSFSGIYVIDLTTRALKSTITLDATANPVPVVTDPAGNIEVGDSQGVLTIDATSDQVIRIMNLGTPVNSIAFASSSVAYGAALGNGVLSYNPSTGAVLRDASHPLRVGDSSVGNLKVFGNKLYVPNFSQDTITSVDLATEATKSSYVVGHGPQELCFVTVPQ